ncbi:MAG: DUF934 domain-containing protein [Pseudomonadota bacterium]
MPLLKFSGNRLANAIAEAPEEIALEDAQAAGSLGEARALLIPNDAALADAGAFLEAAETIILSFPHFKDGRAYSQARQLRDQYGFQGAIRARGDVKRDQLLFMRRCGFSEFEIEGADVEAANGALNEFSFAYQAASDGAAPVWRRRRDQRAAA